MANWMIELIEAYLRYTGMDYAYLVKPNPTFNHKPAGSDQPALPLEYSRSFKSPAERGQREETNAD